MDEVPADIRATAEKLVAWRDSPFLLGLIITALWAERSPVITARAIGNRRT